MFFPTVFLYAILCKNHGYFIRWLLRLPWACVKENGCCIGSYLRLHTLVFWPLIISNPPNTILWYFDKMLSLITVQHIKISWDFIRWLDYYHWSKILGWNLWVWSYTTKSKQGCGSVSGLNIKSNQTLLPVLSNR